MDEFQKYEFVEDSNRYTEDKRKENSKIIKEIIGTSLYNVKMVTE